MTVAYVLMKCELGSEGQIVEKLREIDEVLFVDEIYGAYDIIAKVEASNIEKLREVLTWNIQNIEKVRSTLTVNRKEL